tara:strand:+ start:308 stop:490 length:183 start_codon:yes stop_codon:yes gene_type:complete
MFKKLLKFIFGDKTSNLRNKINKKYVKAVAFQRNGDIRMYSETMSEIEKLENELIKLKED